MQKGLNTKKIIISFLMSIMLVTLLRYIQICFGHNYQIATVFIQGGFFNDRCAFVLRTDNIIEMYPDCGMYEYLDNKNVFDMKIFRKYITVSRKSKQKIEALVHAIKKNGVTEDVQTVDILDGKVVYCCIDDIRYCADFTNDAYYLDLNPELKELAHELVKYAPKRIKDRAPRRVRQKE